MTDGIIQEVFKKLLSNYDYTYNGEQSKMIWKSDIEELQQELIEKIKQEFGSYEGFVMSSELITKTLIGGNQE